MKKCLILCLVLCLLVTAALAETVSFTGTVIPKETVEVYVHSSALAKDVKVRVGEPVAAGDALAVLHVNSVYAPMDGVIAAVYAEPGDDGATVTELQGSVLMMEESVTFTVLGDNAKAFDSLETGNVMLGEKVYLRSRTDETRAGEGVITAIDNTAYTVKGTSGAFIPGETADVFRSAEFTEDSCLGRGTVARTSPIAVTGEGTIVSVAVTAGQKVNKGDLLFTTLPGSADCETLYAPVSGVVAQVNLIKGTAATEDSVAFVLYPQDAMLIEAAIPEADLAYIAQGDAVSISFLWNEDIAAPIAGKVASIAAVPDENGAYAAMIEFSADETVRYGMTATITPGASGNK